MEANSLSSWEIKRNFWCLVFASLLTISATAAYAGPEKRSEIEKVHGPGKSATAGTAKVTASTTKLRGHISAFGMACASNGIVPLSTQIPTMVEEVKKGSPAFYAGVAVGDRILQATIENNLFSLKIERGGRVYLARLQAEFDRSSQDSRLDQTLLAAALRAYQIRLIVDHSGSMYRPLGTSEKLRWVWVKEELEKFCTNVQTVSGNSFDLYLFNESVQTKMALSARQVKSVLDNAVTTGNTNLPAALHAATADSPRPILIILITDGQAVSSKENGAILVENLSRTAALRNSRIVFLQAGYSPEGSLFIASLNDALAARGMSKRTFSALFEEVSHRGILGTIEPLLTH